MKSSKSLIDMNSSIKEMKNLKEYMELQFKTYNELLDN